MKKRIFSLFLLTALTLTGCGVRGAVNSVESAGHALESGAESVKETIKDAAQTTGSANTTLTQAQAQTIALEHAGLTADQVRFLNAKYEIEDGIGRYEVEFYHDNWEYDYEIHAQTGQILSFDKDSYASTGTT